MHGNVISSGGARKVIKLGYNKIFEIIGFNSLI
jgi:hypothetical protein